MDDWRPMAELKAGRYAVGRLADGHEADIYATGADVIDVATGHTITNLVSWKNREAPSHEAPRPSLI
jgi:hypothetical protein